MGLINNHSAWFPCVFHINVLSFQYCSILIECAALKGLFVD